VGTIPFDALGAPGWKARPGAGGSAGAETGGSAISGGASSSGASNGGGAAGTGPGGLPAADSIGGERSNAG
jgi:hypothetical protein